MEKERWSMLVSQLRRKAINYFFGGKIAEYIYSWAKEVIYQKNILICLFAPKQFEPNNIAHGIPYLTNLNISIILLVLISLG